MICILKELKSAHQNDLGAFYKNRDNKRRLTVLAHEADDSAKNGDVFGDDIFHKIVLRVKAEVAVFGKKSLDGGLVFDHGYHNFAIFGGVGALNHDLVAI